MEMIPTRMIPKYGGQSDSGLAAATTTTYNNNDNVLFRRSRERKTKGDYGRQPRFTSKGTYSDTISACRCVTTELRQGPKMQRLLSSMAMIEYSYSCH